MNELRVFKTEKSNRSGRSTNNRDPDLKTLKGFLAGFAENMKRFLPFLEGLLILLLIKATLI